MPKYVFHYFDGRGRGEPARLLFHLAGVNYTDDRIAFDKWPELKPKVPGNSLPYLEIDSQVLGQSLVVFRYLARTFGMDGDNLLEKARIEEIMEYLAELKTKWGGAQFSPEDKKEENKQKFLDYYATACREIERILSYNKSSEGWAVGKKLSIADIMIYESNENALKMAPGFLDKYPRITKCREKFAAHPKVKEYLKKRKETPF